MHWELNCDVKKVLKLSTIDDDTKIDIKYYLKLKKEGSCPISMLEGKAEGEDRIKGKD